MLDVRVILAGMGATVLLSAGAGYLQAQEVPATRADLVQPALVQPAGEQDSRSQYWFGVAVENIPPTIARQLKLKAGQGLMVMMVLPNSPAESAGLRAEDLLVELDGNPLMSHEDLARAANTITSQQVNTQFNKEVAASRMSLIKSSQITFLREGDRKSVTITPAPRPENMLVVGNNQGNFVPQNRPVDKSDVYGVQNIVLPSGTAVQVGPGYTLDLSGDAFSTVSMKSLKQVVGTGGPLVLSKQTDSTGKIVCTISVGNKKYTVEAGKIDALPPDLQPFAQQLLLNAPVQAGAQPVVQTAVQANPPAPAAGNIDARLSTLEKQNQELQRKIQELIELQKQKGGN